jgi:SAM-dependent methyltransferase
MSALVARLHDVVRYLQQVRPLDPGELATYVDSDPASVEMVLAAQATDWGLIRDGSGCYQPAPTTPVPALGWAPEELPPRIIAAGSRLLRGYGGDSWATGDTGDRLRDAIDAMKSDYLTGARVTYDRETALAYLIYHLPRYYATIGYALTPLVESELLGRPLRIADVGAGTGGPMLGIGDRLGPRTLIEYHAIEPSPAVEVLEAMTAETGANLHPQLHRYPVEQWLEDPEGPFDLIVCANVLGELNAPVEVVDALLGCLGEEGALVLVEPGDREQSVRLRSVERQLTGSAGVFAPELRLWPGREPSDTGWGFDIGTQLTPPPWQQQLQAAASDPSGETYLNPHVQFSYSILRPDGTTRFAPSFDRTRVTPLAETPHKITDRINVVGAKLSHDLAAASAGNPVFRVGDGSQTVDHFVVQTVSGELVESIAWVPYGSVCRFEGALVLWNDAEEAVNLVIDHDSVVEPLATPDRRANPLGSGPSA